MNKRQKKKRLEKKCDDIEQADLSEAQWIIDNKLNSLKGDVGDGSHTFNELYYHRMVPTTSFSSISVHKCSLNKQTS